MSGFGSNPDMFDELIRRSDKLMNQIQPKRAPKILKSEKNATLDDLISMIAMICSKSLKKYDAVFNPDEGAIIDDQKEKLEHPYILYKVIERKPKLELKPRQMENIIEDIDDKGNRRFGTVWAQRQTCIVQFDVVAQDYETANKVMSTFEETMFSYSGYFKNKGVAELLFSKYFTDVNLDKYRQEFSVRSIQYSVEIEKLITVFDTTIEDIDT